MRPYLPGGLDDPTGQFDRLICLTYSYPGIGPTVLRLNLRCRHREYCARQGLLRVVFGDLEKRLKFYD